MTKIEKLIEQRSKLHKQIVEELEKLENECGGGDCSCPVGERGQTYDFIHYGHFLEIQCVCIKCGGMRQEE